MYYFYTLQRRVQSRLLCGVSPSFKISLACFILKLIKYLFYKIYFFNNVYNIIIFQHDKNELRRGLNFWVYLPDSTKLLKPDVTKNIPREVDDVKTLLYKLRSRRAACYRNCTRSMHKP